jgi:hypothetical protein
LNSFRNALNTCLYYLILLLSVLDVLGIASLLFYSVKKISDIYSKAQKTDEIVNWSFYLENGAIKIIFAVLGFIICIALLLVLFPSRVKLRNKIYFYENGMHKKWASYDKVSKKEKDHIDKQKSMDVERILDSGALRQITHEASKTPETDMESLTGLHDVKQAMKEMAARMESEKERRKRGN